MTDPKPSTNDILSKIRAKNAAAAPAEQPAAPVAPASEAAAAPEATAPEAKPAAATPKGTGDILAAARAAAKPAGTADVLAAIKKPAAAAPAASGAPKSPSDIMAAIRAKAGAAPAPAEGVAASEKPVAAAKSATPVPAGMSAAEMIKAARSVAEGTPVPPKVVLPAKPLAAKAPAASAKAPAAEIERRSAVSALVAFLLSPMFIAWSSFTTAFGAFGLGVARFMMPNVLVEPPTKFKIGPPNDYAPGTVSTKWQAQFNIWVVNGEVDGAQMIYALSTVCTHLGCTPNWLEGEQKFKCPCHGSGFYKNGVNFEGPAPRPLERVGIRLAEDGMLEVDKSVKFQKELGQWANPACYVGVT
jgi:cytochrome b6-f complex iron-sulfur subunit